MWNPVSNLILKFFLGLLILSPSLSLAAPCNEGVIEKRLAKTPMVKGVVDLFVQGHKDTSRCGLYLVNSFKEIEAPEPGPGYIAVYSCSRKNLPVLHSITITGLCEKGELETLPLNIQKIEFGGLDQDF